MRRQIKELVSTLLDALEAGETRPDVLYLIDFIRGLLPTGAVFTATAAAKEILRIRRK